MLRISSRLCYQTILNSVLHTDSPTTQWLTYCGKKRTRYRPLYAVSLRITITRLWFYCLEFYYTRGIQRESRPPILRAWLCSNVIERLVILSQDDFCYWFYCFERLVVKRMSTLHNVSKRLWILSYTAFILLPWMISISMKARERTMLLTPSFKFPFAVSGREKAENRLVSSSRSVYCISFTHTLLSPKSSILEFD